MAAYLTDTLEHDIFLDKDTSRVAVFSGCVDTTRFINGVIVNMHPSEGVWLFRGTPRTGSFGSMFGDRDVCGAFPTSIPAVKEAGSIVVGDGDAVVRHKSVAEKKREYMCVCEDVFSVFKDMGWNRNNGVVELIPIVVGMP
jgi:hypothetical protein